MRITDIPESLFLFIPQSQSQAGLTFPPSLPIWCNCFFSPSSWAPFFPLPALSSVQSQIQGRFLPSLSHSPPRQVISAFHLRRSSRSSCNLDTRVSQAAYLGPLSGAQMSSRSLSLYTLKLVCLKKTQDGDNNNPAKCCKEFAQWSRDPWKENVQRH